MPTFQGQVSEDQLVQLLAFIKSLQIVSPQPATPGQSPATTTTAPTRATPAANAK